MAGTWQALRNQPTFSASTMLLLTDGTVMCQETDARNWWRLTPDSSGDYVNGSWSQLAPMQHSRLYYASAVLADGRVLVAGGEYSDAGSDTNTAEIFSPTQGGAAGTWTPLTAPSGWANIGDAPCCVLPDGRPLLGQIRDTRTALFDPSSNQWIAGPNKNDPSSEESWALLWDGTVIVAECTNHPQAEKYLPAEHRWTSAGTVPVELVEPSSLEIGAALCLTDGRALFIGADSANHQHSAYTALYHPPANPADPGHWTAGPQFPMISGQPIGAKDAPGCLLPNGKVLCVGGPVDGVSGDYLSPTYCFEFDGHTLNRIADAPNLQSTTVPYDCRMLLVPTGQVLFADGDANIQVYTPDGGPDPDWRPEITACPLFVRPVQRSTLFGRRLNGLSQACTYGDDASMATNYPLVRIRNRKTRKVVYCRTEDHGTMGIGPAVHTDTHFTPPATIEPGPSEISVVANGISSEWRHVHVRRP
jgi:hypothetical protein